MGSAGKRVIEHGDVAFFQFEGLDGGGDRHRHRAEVDGHVVAHGKDLSAAVKDRAGVVTPLLDVGAEGGATESGPHLFRNGVKEVLEYLQPDWVCVIHFLVLVSNKLP